MILSLKEGKRRFENVGPTSVDLKLKLSWSLWVAILSHMHRKAAKAEQRVGRGRNKGHQQRSRDGDHKAPKKRTNIPALRDVKDFWFLVHGSRLL